MALLTSFAPFSALETVLLETPKARAISSNVAKNSSPLVESNFLYYTKISLQSKEITKLFHIVSQNFETRNVEFRKNSQKLEEAIKINKNSCKKKCVLNLDGSCEK